MTRRLIIIIFLSLTFVLSACGAKDSSTTATKTELSEDEIFWMEFFDEKRSNHEDVKYESDRLHAQNPSGYYGDLIPFYDRNEKKLYMYYMTGDTSDLANPKIDMHLSTSTDMFNFREEEFTVYDNITEAVNLHLIERLGFEKYGYFDYETFKEGTRDNYCFFDEEVNRYRYLAICYYKASGEIKCALGLGTSDDETGLKWSSPIKIIHNYDTYKQPECPCVARIDGRWYIFCSLWGNSIHNVGRFEYYIGDPGKTLDDQDWLDKETHYLDGEDLCASQVCKIEDDRYLMYGWIVKCYSDSYYKHNIDNSLWGGDMSIMREVYALENGELAVRLPYGLKGMMRKEKITSIGDGILRGNYHYIEGNFSSTVIEGKINMRDADDFCITLSSSGKDYYILFDNSEGRTRISIGCDKDINHLVASSYDTKELIEDLDIYIVIENNLIELFLNDKYSLSARTSMFSGTYDRISIDSSGNVEYRDFEVSRLANSNNLFD